MLVSWKLYWNLSDGEGRGEGGREQGGAALGLSWELLYLRVECRSHQPSSPLYLITSFTWLFSSHLQGPLVAIHVTPHL